MQDVINTNIKEKGQFALIELVIGTAIVIIFAIGVYLHSKSN